MIFSDFGRASVPSPLGRLARQAHPRCQPLKIQLTPPLTYLITDRRAFRRRAEGASADRSDWDAQLQAVELAAQSGCQLIQIREKDLSARQLTEFARAVVAVARPHGASVLINDRLDIALAADADGIHLRSSSLSAAQARSAVTACRAPRPGFLIGVSTHSLAEARAADASGADFIVCGPLYATPSKAAYGAPLGLVQLAEICRVCSLPVIAIGGISMDNFQAALAAGASGIAAIRLFQELAALQHNIKIMLSSGASLQDRVS